MSATPFLPQALVCAAILSACTDSPVSYPSGEVSRRLGTVTPSQWAALAARRVFFAHQSVGGNVTEGLDRILRDYPAIPVRLVRSSQPDTVPGGAIFHNYVGDNGQPSSKTEGFTAIVLSTQRNPIEIGMQKFCYADFNRHTDVDAIFATYEQRIESLRELRPNLQIVHLTTPLLEERFSVKDIARAALGRTTTKEQLDQVRRYNARLRARYTGVDPIFDLAAIQALGDRGDPNDSHEKESLIPQFATEDGGHLNPLGQEVVAVEFLVFLASLSPKEVPE